MSQYDWIKPGVLAVVKPHSGGGDEVGCILECGERWKHPGFVRFTWVVAPRSWYPRDADAVAMEVLRPLTDPDEFTETDEQRESSLEKPKELA